MKVRNVAIAGAISLAAAAALSSPAYATTQHHHPNPPSHSRPDGCQLSVSNPRPHQGDEETLSVWTQAGRSVVEVQVNFRHNPRVWTIPTDRNGQAFRDFNVGNAASHRTVTVVGEVIAAPRGYRAGATCYTSFTPR